MGSNTYGAKTGWFGTPLTEELGVQVAIRHLQSGYHSCADYGPALPPSSLAVQQAAAARTGLGFRPPEATATYSTPGTIQKVQPAASGRQLSQGSGRSRRAMWKFLRTTEDIRYYHSLNSDLVGMVSRRQGRLRHRMGWPAGAADEQLLRRSDHWCADFATNGFGPARSDAGYHHG